MFTQLDTAVFSYLASFLLMPEQIQLRKISKAFNHKITTEKVLYVTSSEHYSLPEFQAVMDQYAEEDRVLLSRVARSLPENFYQQLVTKVFRRKITSSLRNQINLEIFFLLHVRCPENFSHDCRSNVVNELILRHNHDSEKKPILQAIDRLPEFSYFLLQFTGWVDSVYSNAETPRQQSLAFLQDLRSDLYYRAEEFNSFVQAAIPHRMQTFCSSAKYIILLLCRAEEITSLLQEEKISLQQFFSFEPFFIWLLIRRIEEVVFLMERTKLSLQQLYDVPSRIKFFLLSHIKEVIYLIKETTTSLQELLDLPEHIDYVLHNSTENLVYLIKEGGISLQQLQGFSEDFARWLLWSQKRKIPFTFKYLFKQVLFLFLLILFLVPFVVFPGYFDQITDRAKNIGYACYYQFFIRKIPVNDQVNNELALAAPV